ncbi:MAG: valine--tRNA ligase [Gemmatimonadota bacterium]
MKEPLPPQYDPGAIEGALYQEWEERGYFRADAADVLNGAKPYTIVIPPPNVTAVLHMGHGLNNTLQDVLTRWRRMQGYRALYLPGTDHAGIATQNVVERQLAAEGKTRDEVGRDAFVERVWSFVDETGEAILRQLRVIGCSCDWTRTRFTLEPALSRAVREVFVRLYQKDLIYRGNYIINWCPRCQTALSDEEAEGEETNGKLYHVRYPLTGSALGLPHLPDGRPFIVVATTRPETMLGDTAVAVHPGDPRYHSVIGALIELPLTARQIPIIADEYADPEFGSGAVKITPAHDANDFNVAQRHSIPALNVLTPDAHINDNAPPAFRGLDRFEARKRVVAALTEQGLIEKIEDHRLTVPHCYRCDTVVEPRLSDQWFVRMKPLAEPALAAARDGRLRFTPDRWTKVYENWLENIRDWCISRQLWWGHRIPVWYCQNASCKNVIVAVDDPTSCSQCGGSELVQDADVLDTWFSSWLWPFSTLGWPEETEDVKAFYPTQTLVTAADILFFWVARMVMAGLEFRGEVPFADVYLNGIVRDHKGRKMSKSLNNGIDPLEVVKLFGADALRYTVIAGAGIGNDVLLDYENLPETFAPGRNFSNKIWNAGRFALMNLDDAVPTLDQVETELADRWILSRLNLATREVTDALEAFRFHEAAGTVHRFFWSELADWYLELVKPRFQLESMHPSRAAAQATLVEVLDGVFRLMHPLMPFISEALWRRLPDRAGVAKEPSLIVAKWPEPRADREFLAEGHGMEALIELIMAIRSIRSEYNVQPVKEIDVVLTNPSAMLVRALESEERAVKRLARVGALTRTRGDAPANAGAHVVLRGGTDLFIPLAGLIDVDKERVRLQSELERIEALLRSTEAKLSNEQFVSRAPEQVVANERAKVDSLRDQHTRLQEKLKALSTDA